MTWNELTEEQKYHFWSMLCEEFPNDDMPYPRYCGMMNNLRFHPLAPDLVARL